MILLIIASLLAMKLEKSDDLAKHQAVKKNNGMEHASGEKMLKEEKIDTAVYSEEETSVENTHNEHDDLAIDVSITRNTRYY